MEADPITLPPAVKGPSNASSTQHPIQATKNCPQSLDSWSSWESRKSVISDAIQIAFPNNNFVKNLILQSLYLPQWGRFHGEGLWMDSHLFLMICGLVPFWINHHHLIPVKYVKIVDTIISKVKVPQYQLLIHKQATELNIVFSNMPSDYYSKLINYVCKSPEKALQFVLGHDIGKLETFHMGISPDDGDEQPLKLVNLNWDWWTKNAPKSCLPRDNSYPEPNSQDFVHFMRESKIVKISYSHIVPNSNDTICHGLSSYKILSKYAKNVTTSVLQVIKKHMCAHQYFSQVTTPPDIPFGERWVYPNLKNAPNSFASKSFRHNVFDGVVGCFLDNWGCRKGLSDSFRSPSSKEIFSSPALPILPMTSYVNLVFQWNNHSFIGQSLLLTFAAISLYYGKYPLVPQVPSSLENIFTGEKIVSELESYISTFKNTKILFQGQHPWTSKGKRFHSFSTGEKNSKRDSIMKLLLIFKNIANTYSVPSQWFYSFEYVMFSILSKYPPGFVIKTKETQPTLKLLSICLHCCGHLPLPYVPFTDPISPFSNKRLDLRIPRKSWFSLFPLSNGFIGLNSLKKLLLFQFDQLSTGIHKRIQYAPWTLLNQTNPSIQAPVPHSVDSSVQSSSNSSTQVSASKTIS